MTLTPHRYELYVRITALHRLILSCVATVVHDNDIICICNFGESFCLNFLKINLLKVTEFLNLINKII